jgi:hypothetical protein
VLPFGINAIQFVRTCTDVSDEHNASTIRVEEQATRENTVLAQGQGRSPPTTRPSLYPDLHEKAVATIHTGKVSASSLKWLFGFQEVKAPGSSRHSAL